MPLSPTLTEGLNRYGIGEAIRALRLRKKMGLVELGRHSGLSPALLSKIERGRLFPTHPTLLRIALVFSVGLEYFFTAARERRAVGVVRHGHRKRFPEAPGLKEPAYHFESLDYEAHESMALAVLAGIADEVVARFGVERLAIVHRTGVVPLGEVSIAVVAAAPHRGAAFEAARYAIDETKARAPIWKAERFEDGHVWIGHPARSGPEDEEGTPG